MDITYIPMARGFVYLAVVLDWFSPTLSRGLLRALALLLGRRPGAHRRWHFVELADSHPRESCAQSYTASSLPPTIKVVLANNYRSDWLRFSMRRA
jgi:hypothetical protein